MTILIFPLKKGRQRCTIHSQRINENVDKPYLTYHKVALPYLGIIKTPFIKSKQLHLSLTQRSRIEHGYFESERESGKKADDIRACLGVVVGVVVVIFNDAQIILAVCLGVAGDCLCQSN
jgi:hypothetical protein